MSQPVENLEDMVRPEQLTEELAIHIATERGEAGEGDIRVRDLLQKEAAVSRLGALGYIEEKILKGLDASGALAEAGLSPLADVSSLWLRAQLETAQNPTDAIKQVLRSPATGGWLAYMNRRLKGLTSDESPLAGHAGYVHTMAATAGIRAGLDFMLSVPGWGGTVMLPDLGMVTLRQPADAAEWGSASVTAHGNEITLSDGAATVVLPRASLMDAAVQGWEPLSTVRVDLGGTEYCILLDDISPYRRQSGPVAPNHNPHKLDAKNKARWLKELKGTLELLARDHPHSMAEYDGIMHTVVPLNGTPVLFRTQSGTGGDTRGAAEMGEQHTAVPLHVWRAETFFHEGEHSRFYNVLHLAELMGYPLHRQGPEGPATTYAPWRDDPRPGFGLLNGAAAFLAVANYWAERAAIEQPGSREQLGALLEVALWRDQLLVAFDQLVDNNEVLTEQGLQVVAAMRGKTLELQNVTIPADLRALANTATAYHHARWLAHHMQPAETSITALTEAWLTRPGDAPPELSTPDELHNEPTAWRFDIWAILARWQVDLPDAWNKLRHAPTEDVSVLVPEATPADVKRMGGDIDGARDEYLAVLSTPGGHADARAITGWAFTIADPAVAAFMQQRPFVYRAVQRKIVETTGRPADPVQLAQWLAQGQSPPPAANN